MSDFITLYPIKPISIEISVLKFTQYYHPAYYTVPTPQSFSLQNFSLSTIFDLDPTYLYYYYLQIKTDYTNSAPILCSAFSYSKRDLWIDSPYSTHHKTIVQNTQDYQDSRTFFYIQKIPQIFSSFQQLKFYYSIQTHPSSPFSLIFQVILQSTTGSIVLYCFSTKSIRPN